MAGEYSREIVDLIEKRWAEYDYDRSDVVDMVARISRPSCCRGTPVTDAQRARAEELLAACD